MSEAISQAALEAAAAEVEQPTEENPTVVIPPAPVIPPVQTVDELREKLQVRPPSEIMDWVNLLVYGDPGVGKTYLGGTADDDERTSPVLVLDIEGGVVTLRNKQGVDVIPVRSMAKIEEIHADLYHSIKDGKLYYKTIMVDSLPELADLDMRTIMKQAKAKNPETTDIDVPSPREWGKQRNHMRLIVRAFRDLPCNVIYTAQLAVDQEEGQPNKYRPAFAGKLKTEVPGFMDVVGYYTAEVDPFTKEVIRKMQVQGTKRVVAKDRSSSLGGIVINPTIPMIWDLINSSPQAHELLTQPIPELEGATQ